MNKNKNICFFNSCLAWGGGEKWYKDTARQLSKKGYNITFFLNQKSELYKKIKKEDIELVPIRVGNLSFLNIKKIIKLIKIFRRKKIKIIILNLPSDLKLVGIAGKLAGVEQIIYRRGSAIPIKNTKLNKFLLNHCVTKIIANSETTKRTILQNTNRWLNEKKIKVIYNGINLNEIDVQKWNYLYKREKKEIILGNAGRLNKQKGQIYLIDIAVELKKRDIDFKILIAGIGDLEKELKEYAKAKKVREKIIFLGFVENIKSFMMSIDIFLLTSLWEGFGYVMVEAMSSKKPVIAFDVSNISEIVDNGKTGYLIPDFNINQMCDKIEKIGFDKKIQIEMGEEGYKKVEEKFEIKNAINELEKMLS